MDSDVHVIDSAIYFLPAPMRVPLVFGHTAVSTVECVRVAVVVEDRYGRTATGWGEVPLNLHWAWTDPAPEDAASTIAKDLVLSLAESWKTGQLWGHPMEIASVFLSECVPTLVSSCAGRSGVDIPRRVVQLCMTPFDLATHDAYGILHDLPVYETYTGRFLNRDLTWYFGNTSRWSSVVDRYPAYYLASPPARRLSAWHLVGGADPISAEDRLVPPGPAHQALDDGYPVYLRDWILRDGIQYLKIKLCGSDPDRDFERVRTVAHLGRVLGVRAFSVDFNCTVLDVDVVVRFLDDLARREPLLFDMLCYVEQPFPADEGFLQRDVTAISRRKPLLLDESALSWHDVRDGMRQGWTGVALKTCKMQTATMLMYCWAREHGIPVVVQDLTNPMLAQLSHLQLAAHVHSPWGVETNSMQFYPEVSAAEATIHPGVFRRKNGHVELSTVSGPGFGYRLAEINRALPSRAA